MGKLMKAKSNRRCGMKRVMGMLVLAGWFLLMPGWWIPSAMADETPALVNNPAGAVNLAKQIVNYIQPSYETVWDVWNGDFYQGVSGSLWNFTSHQIPIASVRLGVSTGMAIYSGASLDLPGLAHLIPVAVKSPVSVSPLDEVWKLIGKYGRVGIVGGWSWDHDDPVIGITAGAAFTF